MTDGMKWAIILGVIGGVFFFGSIFCATFLPHRPQEPSDYEQAKQMCGSKGVAHFTYQYIAANETEQPDVTCKQ